MYIVTTGLHEASLIKRAHQAAQQWSCTNCLPAQLDEAAQETLLYFVELVLLLR